MEDDKKLRNMELGIFPESVRGFCVHGPYHGQRLINRERWFQVFGMVPFYYSGIPEMLGIYRFDQLVDEWHWFPGKY